MSSIVPEKSPLQLLTDSYHLLNHDYLGWKDIRKGGRVKVV